LAYCSRCGRWCDGSFCSYCGQPQHATHQRPGKSGSTAGGVILGIILVILVLPIGSMAVMSAINVASHPRCVPYTETVYVGYVDTLSEKIVIMANMRIITFTIRDYYSIRSA
jgi:hypothetical protein